MSTTADDYTLGEMVRSLQRIERDHGEALADIKRETKATNGAVAGCIRDLAAAEKRIDRHDTSFQNVYRKIDELAPKTAQVGTVKDAKSKIDDPATLSLTISPRMVAILGAIFATLGGGASIVMPLLLEWARRQFFGAAPIIEKAAPVIEKVMQ
jgi:hypothetical protein